MAKGMRRAETPPVPRIKPADEVNAMDFPITIRMPADLRAALSRATVDDGRPSASDMIRVILYDYLRRRNYIVDTPPVFPSPAEWHGTKVPCAALRRDGQPCMGTHRQHPSGMCLHHRTRAGLDAPKST